MEFGFLTENGDEFSTSRCSSYILFFCCILFFTSQQTVYLNLPLTSLPVFQQEDEQQDDMLLLQDGAEDSGESDAEDEARLQRQPTRGAAWVDEDDELEEA